VRKLIEVQRDHAFTTHTYKHTTMGFLKDIEDMPNQFAYSRQFFDRWYRPEHTTVIVAGDVNPPEVMALVEKHWGGWKRGRYTVDIPREPEPKAPVHAHVPWPTAVPPWVTVAFHAPAFSETDKAFAALDVLGTLTFGETSDVYKKLVEQEQKVDQLFFYYPPSADPGLATIAARVKRPEDALAVRDELLRAVARAAAEPLPAARLRDALSAERYAFARGLDSTDAIAGTLARFVRYRRSFDTLNAFYRVYESLTPEDLQAVARATFTDARLVLTDLSQQPLPGAMAKAPALSSLAPAAAAAALDELALPSKLPALDVKLLFRVGSAHDPKGKEGLAQLAATMVTDTGSEAMRIDEIRKALFPLAASFDARVDREMTAITGRVHADNWKAFLDAAVPMLTAPGFREEDFRRVRDRQKVALTEDLRNNNEEELGKERLQQALFAGTPYGHPVLGTVAGLDAITLDDVKAFVHSAYTREALTVGFAGDVPEALKARLRRELAALPAGPALPPPAGVAARRPQGLEVEVIEKETRATAISLGFPIEVTRKHPDFAALSVARSWLGEHRASSGRLFNRIREVRGMNYGDYAYIEAFPRGMFQFFPDPNLARRAQLFEIWIRPVAPENAHHALRIALHELDQLVEKGMSAEDFQTTRDYLAKNVFLLTATQGQQLGYALDSKWYGIGEYAPYLRAQLAQLTVGDVNRAVRKHLQAKDALVVAITKDAKGLRDQLLSDAPSSVKYDAPKPEALQAEDRLIGARKLGLRPEAVRITPVEAVFRE
jgi:zinc protease